VAAIGNLSEQAGFTLKKILGCSVEGQSISFLGKPKKSFLRGNQADVNQYKINLL
jgi:hypothetical protein